MLIDFIAVVLDSKKRPHEEDEKKMDIKFAPFVGLSIEEQLKKLKTHFGWSSSYLSDAVKFIDSTIGKLALKNKKLPFGDLVTGLGLQDEPILQLLVDVQGKDKETKKYCSFLLRCIM